MDDYLREMIEQGKEQSAFETMITVVKTLMENNKSFDEVCRLLHIDDKTREKLLETGDFNLN